jgi:hypothetical protein
MFLIFIQYYIEQINYMFKIQLFIEPSLRTCPQSPVAFGDSDFRRNDGAIHRSAQSPDCAVLKAKLLLCSKAEPCYYLRRSGTLRRTPDIVYLPFFYLSLTL